jgi:hypothetical protein
MTPVISVVVHLRGHEAGGQMTSGGAIGICPSTAGGDADAP